MPVTKLVFQKKKYLTYSIIIASIIFAVFLSIILMVAERSHQRETIDTTAKFMVFESKVEKLIYSKATLLQGYDAYIKSNQDIDEEDAYLYLDNLLSESQGYVRNIGVIKDTTIIWNYPKKDNDAAIGVDLAKIEEQKTILLKVKDELRAVMQGPVSLVQGGEGFIIRLPITMEETGYWGQISVVLKGDKIIEEINSYADISGINVAIFNEQNKNTPFCGDLNQVGEEYLTFEIDKSFLNWTAYVSPETGWKNNANLFLFALFMAIILSALIGMGSYNIFESKYKFIRLSMHDSLSGLLNRHFLEGYQESVLSGTKVEGYKVGIMSLDLNNFKDINDTYGHGTGDMVLVETARLLKDIPKDNKAVFRLGGDEFLVVLPEIENRENIELIKKQLIKSFEEDFKISNHKVKATISIGIALFPDDGTDIDVLLQVADKQMYEEKEYFKKNMQYQIFKG